VLKKQIPVIDSAKVADTSMRKVLNVRLPPEHFSVLTQVRRTYDIDHDLALSIHAHGQMSVGFAAVLSHANAATYVEVINQIYGTEHKVSELNPVNFDGEVCYLVIFAGHRRHRHVAHVNAEIAAGRLPHADPTRFDGRYRAALHFGITPEEAIELQFNENRYTAPPLHEEAEAAWRLYRYKKLANPKLTIAEFARSDAVPRG
jgi:hypothetical protein